MRMLEVWHQTLVSCLLLQINSTPSDTDPPRQRKSWKLHRQQKQLCHTAPQTTPFPHHTHTQTQQMQRIIPHSHLTVWNINLNQTSYSASIQTSISGICNRHCDTHFHYYNYLTVEDIKHTSIVSEQTKSTKIKTKCFTFFKQSSNYLVVYFRGGKKTFKRSRIKNAPIPILFTWI